MNQCEEDFTFCVASQKCFTEPGRKNIPEACGEEFVETAGSTADVRFVKRILKLPGNIDRHSSLLLRRLHTKEIAGGFKYERSDSQNQTCTRPETIKGGLFQMYAARTERRK